MLGGTLLVDGISSLVNNVAEDNGGEHVTISTYSAAERGYTNSFLFVSRELAWYGAHWKRDGTIEINPGTRVTTTPSEML